MGGRKQSKHYASHENIGADFPIQSRSLYIRTAATAAAPRVENKLSCLLASLHHQAAEPNSLWHHVSSTAAPSQTSDRPSACDSSPKPCRILSPPHHRPSIDGNIRQDDYVDLYSSFSFVHLSALLRLPSLCQPAANNTRLNAIHGRATFAPISHAGRKLIRSIAMHYVVD